MKDDDEDLDFEIEDGILYSYDGNDKKVKIPNNVKVIAEKAFEECKEIEEIIIPKGVKEIQRQAFRYCSALKRIKISSTVKKIDKDAFAIAGKLENIDVDQENPTFTSVDGVLYSKNKETLIEVPTAKEGDFNIPNTVKRLENGCFEYCEDLESITIPSSVKEIGRGVFASTLGLKSLVVDKDNKNFTSINYIVYSKDETKLIGATGGISGVINVPNSVISIEEDAFDSCEYITEIKIPDSVLTIGKEAFSCCYNLREVKISESVTKIGEDAFSECESLERITVDKFNENYASIDGVLYDKEFETLICAPSFIRGTVKIPNTVKCIENFAFDSCNDITQINIPDSVETIGGGAFMFCKSLKTVTLGKNLKTIWKGAFTDCISLKEIIIPNKVEVIESEAFQNCRKLKKVVIGESVKKIGDQAFYGCESLSSITIPDSVTEMGECAFCSALETLKKITVPKHLKDYFTSENFKAENHKCKVIVK